MGNFTLNNEKELLKRAAENDEAAFAELFYAYHNRLGAFAFRLTQSREIAEEIVQDTFMKIWMDRQALTSIRDFGAYLYTVSRNQAFNCWRSLAREKIRHQEMIKNIKKSYDVISDADSSSHYLRLIDRAVEELPPQQQKVYILSRRERMKYEEIARYMGISRETVKKYLQLATHFIVRYVRSNADLLGLVLLLLLFF